MEKLTFPAHIRDRKVLPAKLRSADLIPAEYYGKGVENISLQLSYQDFRRLFRKSGYNTVIVLDIEGKEKKNVLVHRVQMDPVKDSFMHVEFINVRMDQEVTTTVPVRLEGQAPAVKEFGGVLIQVLDEIEITCLPADLIHEVVLPLDSLVDFNAALHISDIRLSDKIRINHEPEQMIASVSAPAEEEEAPAEPVDVSAVEVTTEKKEGEGEIGEKSEEKEG